MFGTFAPQPAIEPSGRIIKMEKNVSDLLSGPASAPRRCFSLPGLILWLSVVTGLVLSVVSLYKICSSCSETADYRVFGMDFGWFGIAFFSLSILAVALRRRFPWFIWIGTLLLFAAAGAETHFIWIQKYEIGQWCPICLSIAAVVFISCIAMAWDTYGNSSEKGVTMKSKFAYLVIISLCFITGLGVSVLGVKREAEAGGLDLFLGRRSASTTVYFVSDWFCPACRKAEPVIEKIYPEIVKSVRISFVDFPIHNETLNFTPYNTQFLAFEKTKYISLRRALSALSLKTRNPTEADVRAAIEPLGAKLRPMNYSDTLYGMQANLMVYRGYNVRSTPTVVVVNGKTQKNRLLVGEAQINLTSVKAAIAEVERR